MIREYLRPESVEEAVSLGVHFGDKARYIAGGTELIARIKERQANPSCLISLKGIPGIDRIEEREREVWIGALVTHRQIEFSPLVRRHFPALIDAVENIGSVQIRNVATLCGNIATAIPSADGAIPLIVLGARVCLTGPRGERVMALEDFFVGPRQTVLEQGEILSRIIVPKSPPRTGSTYWKHMRRSALELPLLGVAGLLSLSEDGKTCLEARIGLGVVAPTPMRAVHAENILKGKKLDDALLTEAGKAAAGECRPRDTARGEAWYRKEMVEVLVPRVIRICLDRISSAPEGHG